jgi:hypothetical protein
MAALDGVTLRKNKIQREPDSRFSHFVSPDGIRSVWAGSAALANPKTCPRHGTVPEVSPGDGHTMQPNDL